MSLFRRLRRIVANMLLTIGAVAAILLLVEGVFRLFPSLLPAGLYGYGRPDPNLGMNVHGKHMLYNKVDRIWKVPNPDGFMDVPHAEARPPGVVRVGIFGDSYVEALQVPHQDTFFRRLPRELGGRPIEPLAFGIGGWGTLHSLINFRHKAPRYDLDIIVYAFVENDLGDNDYVLQRRLGGAVSPRPYALLSEDSASYEVLWLRPPGERPLWFRPAKWAQQHFLLAQVVWDRILLIRKAGLRTRLSDATAMSETAGDITNSNALPSTWKPVDAMRAKRLGALLIEDWRDEVMATGREFLVLYVPRSEAMLRGDYGLDQTWRPWLGETCRNLGISLIDPSDALRARLGAGEHVYGDHFTAAGHEVVSRVLAEALTPVVARLEP